jgi:hypothetical protein
MRAFLLIGLIGSAVAAVTPASAQVVRCADNVFREARDCPGARQAPPAVTIELQRPSAPVNSADAEDLARVENLRARCEAASAAIDRNSTGRTANGLPDIGGVYGGQLAIAYCSQYERAQKDRQRYESLRSQDPAAAAKELEAQRAAREERRSNRPVITNCNAWAPDHVTCISQ